MTEQENMPRPDEKPLESWKEIAVYLSRDVRTVTRWEKSEGLPVHRHVHQARASVYAYPSELEGWKTTRRLAEDQAPQGWLWTWPVRLPAFAMTLLLALVTAGGGLIHPPASAAGDGGVVARQVLAGPFVDTLGAPSRDGRFLSMMNWGTGNWETGSLVLRDLKSGQERTVTSWSSPAFQSGVPQYSIPSPDGNQVAFSWFSTKSLRAELYLASLDGTSPRLLFDSEDIAYLVPQDWTPDGESILVVLARKDGTKQLVLISGADGSVRTLKSFDWRGPLKASMSPDGKYVVYDFPPKENSQERDIFLLASDGSREARVVQDSPNDIFPMWAPDGAHIVFASDRTGSMGLWALEVAQGNPVGSPNLVKADVGRMQPMGLTRAGTLYYGLNSAMTDVYVAELDFAAGSLLQPPAPVSQRFVGANRFPEWSPDGKHLAYMSHRVPGPRYAGLPSIIIRTLASGEERELVPAMHQFTRPRWSPDGRTLMVTGNDAKGRFGIHGIDVRTGAVNLIARLDPPTYIPSPVWSPDGASIFYTQIAGQAHGQRLLRRELKTGREKELFRGSATFMAVSPDGAWLVFQAWSEQRMTTLMLIPASGGEPRKLVELPASEGIPPDTLAWTRDGKYILFTKANHNERQQGNSLWRVSPEGGEPQQLGLKGLLSLRVHPDGRRVAFSAGLGAGQKKNEIWVLENFLPVQKAAK